MPAANRYPTGSRAGPSWQGKRQGAPVERREAAKIVAVPLRHRVAVFCTASDRPLDEGARVRFGVEEFLQAGEAMRLALRPGPGERFDAGRAQEGEQQQERGEAAAPADEERPHLIEEQRGRKGDSLRSCEEIEYCLRLERGGQAILYLPSAGVRHHVGTQRLTAVSYTHLTLPTSDLV